MTWTGGLLNFPVRACSAVARRVGAKSALLVARANCAQVGHRVHVACSVYLQQPAFVSIGDDCKIYGGVSVVSELAGGRLKLQDGVQVNVFAFLDTPVG